MEQPTAESSAKPEIQFERLVAFFAANPFDGAIPFADELKANDDFHLTRLAARPQLGVAINDAMTAVEYFTKNGVLAVHPCWSQNICSVLYLLLLDFENRGGTEETIAVTEATFCAAVTFFLTLCDGQINSLCAYLLDIRDRFAGMSLKDARFILLELPVGNSLIVALLKDLLEPLLPVLIVRAALNRNDRSQDGITREELLGIELAKVGLNQNDIIVLLDEWKTGTNFRRVNQRVMAIAPGGTFFFPFAFLMKDDSTNEKAKKRFVDYAREHDEILNKVGFGGLEFRRRLPAIESLGLFTQYFFWAENDRMAGYRKMQVHGSFFSSVDRTIEVFRTEPAVLEEVLREAWKGMTDDGRLNPDAEFDEAEVRAVFSECIADYAAIRDKFEHCADDFNAGGVLNDEEVREYASKVFSRTTAVVKGRLASIAIDAARRYLSARGGLNPTDCYYFDGHAPIAGILEGRAALWQRTTLGLMKARLTVLAAAR